MCLEVPEGGCGQNRPGALRFPGGFPGRACSVWWDHPQEGSCCHPSRCILTLAQGCARDVSGDCDITGWRRSEKGVPGAPGRGPGPGPDKMEDPQENAAGKPPELEGRPGVTGGVGGGLGALPAWGLS